MTLDPDTPLARLGRHPAGSTSTLHIFAGAARLAAELGAYRAPPQSGHLQRSLHAGPFAIDLADGERIERRWCEWLEWLDGDPDDVDQLAFDADPDRCWRCDALPAAGDVGLCSPCHLDLAG